MGKHRACKSNSTTCKLRAMRDTCAEDVGWRRRESALTTNWQSTRGHSWTTMTTWSASRTTGWAPECQAWGGVEWSRELHGCRGQWKSHMDTLRCTGHGEECWNTTRSVHWSGGIESKYEQLTVTDEENNQHNEMNLPMYLEHSQSHLYHFPCLTSPQDQRTNPWASSLRGRGEEIWTAMPELPEMMWTHWEHQGTMRTQGTDLRCCRMS